MSRTIYCNCGEYLGEIRDAKLRKNIVFQCHSCAEAAKVSEMLAKASVKKESHIDAFMKGFNQHRRG